MNDLSSSFQKLPQNMISVFYKCLTTHSSVSFKGAGPRPNLEEALRIACLLIDDPGIFSN